MSRWRAVLGWDGFYEVSVLGEVRSLPRASRPRSVVLTPETRRGYLRVRLVSIGRRTQWRPVHQLVLEAFRGPRPLRQHARHRDGNKRNNHVDNLTWGFPADNRTERALHRRHPGSVVPPCVLEQASLLRAQGMSWPDIAARLDWATQPVASAPLPRCGPKEDPP